MTKEEALKLALEALETHVPHVYKDRGYAPINAIKEALAQPEQEPVAWMYSITGALFDTCPQDADDGEFLPLYTTPPQRTWQGLTLGEAVEIWKKTEKLDEAIKLVEAKLKEKNNDS